MTAISKTHTRDVKTPRIALGFVAAGTLAIALGNPHTGGFPTCWILWLTGYQCPTCGGTRAVYDMVHLDFAGAWAMNPVLTIYLPILAVLLVGWWWRAWRGYRALTVPAWVVIVFGAILVAFGILRNIF